VKECGLELFPVSSFSALFVFFLRESEVGGGLGEWVWVTFWLWVFGSRETFVILQ